MAVRCRTTHRTAPSRSVHRHHPRWGPRQYRFTAGQRCPSYRRAISGTSISATVVGTSSIEVFAPTATTTPTAAGAATSAGRRIPPCAPSAARQRQTGPTDDGADDPPAPGTALPTPDPAGHGAARRSRLGLGCPHAPTTRCVRLAQASRAAATSESVIRQCRPILRARNRPERICSVSQRVVQASERATSSREYVAKLMLRLRQSAVRRCGREPQAGVGARHSEHARRQRRTALHEGGGAPRRVPDRRNAETCQRGDAGAAGVHVGGAGHGVASGEHTDKGRKNVESL